MFNPPTVEDLQETRRANEKLVLAALDSKPEWVETELAKTTSPTAHREAETAKAHRG